MSRLAALLRRLRADRRGAVFVIGAFAILLTGAMSMFTADLARVQLARVRVQAAADAAMLAAARDLGRPEATLTEIARNVFDANMAQATRDLTVTRFALSFGGGPTVDSSDTVRLEVDSKLPLLTNIASLALGWMETADPTDPKAGAKPLVFEPVELTTVAAARKITMGAEIMMVLDNTGSMNGQPIADLRTAARTLTEAVFAGRESVPNVYMGLVNYSATVNIGRLHAHWLKRPLATVDAEFAPTTWKGCVRVRSNALAETDDPPSVASFEPQFWPSSRLPTTPATWDAWYLANNAHRNIWPPGDAKDPTKIDAKKPPVDEKQSSGNNGYGPNLGCPAPITPLISSRATILKAIDDNVDGIAAWHRGGTFGNVGLAWGWRAISPRWRGEWRNAAGVANPALPLDYDTPFHNKIIVMMTDGVNQHHQTDMTAYGRPNEMIAPNQVDPSMLRLCENIKREGIIVFTITFGGSVNAGTRNTYTTCASPQTLQKMPGQKYFHAPTGPELVSVFGRIAGQISELRLVK